MRIKIEEIRFHPHSFGDPDGRLFWWNDQLYRGIGAAKVPVVHRLFDAGIVQRLVARGLLPGTELTELTLADFPLVIRHDMVPLPSYPNEWCPAMFKDGVLAVIDLVEELTAHGFTLKDYHLWNLLFDSCQPVYVDFNSIVPQEGYPRWPDREEFCHTCLYPLRLMASGHDRIARLLLPEYDGVLESEVEALAPVRKLEKFLRSQTTVRREVESIVVPEGKPETVPVDAAIKQIVAELRPSSVLDIGSRGGWFAKAAGCRAVYFETNIATVTQLYREAQAQHLPVLPLVMDFTKPTPALGFASHFSIAAAERLRCDLVFAESLVEELVRKRYLQFDQIVTGLAEFTGRWLLVKFSPPEKLAPALERHFKHVRVLPGTSWLCCEK